MDSLRNRIMKEYEDLQKNKTENAVEVWLVDNNMRHWKGKIKGPVLFILTIDRYLL
jgi:ubiquitin-protein ligase